MVQKMWVVVILVMGLTRIGGGQDKSGIVAADQENVWKMEQSYWEYVKTLDLKGYRTLWHEEFVGWPSVAAMPVHKDHITDWIDVKRAEGKTLQCYKLEHAGFTQVGEVAVTHYHLTDHWLDKSGKGELETVKVTHTWLRVKDSWQIIGGMAAVVPTRPGCE